MASAVKKRTARKHSRSESMHHLVSSLTYRASVGRSLLFFIMLAPFFVYMFASLQGITELGQAVSQSFLPLLGIVAAFFIYDFLYISLRYYYPIPKLADQLILFLVELGIFLLLLLPLLWLELSSDFTKISSLAIVATTPVFVLLVRVLLGVRASQPKGKK